ncbi:MAG: TetR/AcrR family transcriptional regulator [Halanaerobiales bacterium]|nr:TetR/AcrR family transcriptional regulator [Halanaerobiales bacterium]
MSTKRKSTDERKKEALEVAQKIIYEEGFYKLTVRNIAEKMDISEAALYRHFKDKEDILDKLTDLVFYQGCKLNTVDYDDSLDILNNFIDKQIDLFESKPYLSIISFQDDMFREYPSIKRKFIEHQDKREKQLINIMKSGIQNNVIDENVNPDAFASIFMGSIRITVLKWKNKKFSYSLKDSLNEIKSELFQYIEGDQ